MGSIRKRNGKFQAQVRREGLKPISKTFHTKKVAEVWVRGIEASIDAGEVNLTMPRLLLCLPNKSVRHFVFSNNYRWLSQNHPTTSKDVFARLVAGNTTS